LDGVIIERNTVGTSGGGVYNDKRSYPNIKNTTIADNRANGSGGGITSNEYSITELTNVTVSGNQAFSDTGALSYGGGIDLGRASAVMTNVLIENNYTGNRGGGIHIALYDPVQAENHRAAIFITNGIIRNNRADANGGGITAYFLSNRASGTVIYLGLTNVLIADNTSAGNGGGMFLYNSSTTSGSQAGHGVRARLTNVTITGNSSANGNGIYTEGKSAGDNHVAVSVYNSVIWGNHKTNSNDRTTNIADGSGRNTYYNSLVESLSLTTNTGAHTNYTTANKNFNPATWSINGPLDSDYKLGAYAGTLINGGDNGNYNYLKSKTTAGGDTDVTAILNEAAGTTGSDIRGNIPAEFDQSVGRMVNQLDKDAPPAAGTGTASAGNRIQGTAIDVGAYENQ
jgi:hypothetical protein